MHVIVGLDAIAIGQRGAHRRRPAPTARMPKCIAVGEYHTSTSVGVVGRRAVHRRVAREPGEHRRLRPHRLVELAVDLDRLIDDAAARRRASRCGRRTFAPRQPSRPTAAPCTAWPAELARHEPSNFMNVPSYQVFAAGINGVTNVPPNGGHHRLKREVGH